MSRNDFSQYIMTKREKKAYINAMEAFKKRMKRLIKVTKVEDEQLTKDIFDHYLDETGYSEEDIVFLTNNDIDKFGIRRYPLKSVSGLSFKELEIWITHMRSLVDKRKGENNVPR